MLRHSHVMVGSSIDMWSMLFFTLLGGGMYLYSDTSR